MSQLSFPPMQISHSMGVYKLLNEGLMSKSCICYDRCHSSLLPKCKVKFNLMLCMYDSTLIFHELGLNTATCMKHKWLTSYNAKFNAKTINMYTMYIMAVTLLNVRLRKKSSFKIIFLLNQQSIHCYKPKVHGVFMVSTATSTSVSFSCSNRYFAAPFWNKKEHTSFPGNTSMYGLIMALIVILCFCCKVHNAMYQVISIMHGNKYIV